MAVVREGLASLELELGGGVLHGDFEVPVPSAWCLKGSRDGWGRMGVCSQLLYS